LEKNWTIDAQNSGPKAVVADKEGAANLKFQKDGEKES